MRALFHTGPSDSAKSASNDEDLGYASADIEAPAVKSDAVDGLLSNVVGDGLRGLYHASSALLGEPQRQGGVGRSVEGFADGVGGDWANRAFFPTADDDERANCAVGRKGIKCPSAATCSSAAGAGPKPKRAKAQEGKAGSAKASK